eukprot:6037257-Prorocentrum_lima.AAC.1
MGCDPVEEGSGVLPQLSPGGDDEWDKLGVVAVVGLFGVFGVLKWSWSGVKGEEAVLVGGACEGVDNCQ